MSSGLFPFGCGFTFFCGTLVFVSRGGGGGVFVFLRAVGVETHSDGVVGFAENSVDAGNDVVDETVVFGDVHGGHSRGRGLERT